MLFHISAFHPDVDSDRASPWHCLAPMTRILCALILVLAGAFTPNGHWFTWALYAVGLAILTLLSRITLPVLLRRMVVEFLFIALVLLGTLFHSTGEVVWQWGWLRVTDIGITTLGSVTLKAILSLWVVNILILTTSIPALLHGLLALRVPPLLVAILAAMYRYVAVLLEEVQAMQRAALSRNLTSNRRWHRFVIGNMIGALFIRTLDRGERVYQAMLARGYQGVPPIASLPAATWRDGVAITLTAALALLGQGLYLLRNSFFHAS